MSTNDTELGDRVVLGEEKIYNVYGADYDYGEGNPSDSVWDPVDYCNKIEIKVNRTSDDGMELEFDLINTEPAFANALRRILIAEVPTIAIEKVYLYQNTSLLPDDMLTHRLGLIPVKVDPRLFKDSDKIPSNDPVAVEPSPDENEAVVFELKVKCTRNTQTSASSSTDPKELYLNSNVYSSDFHWVPIGDQEGRFADNPPTMVHPDVLVAKLRPGQELECRCHCYRGIGRDHAKFSPVSTATYRLVPEIRFKREFVGDEAHRVKESFSDGVIEVVRNEDGDEVARVKNARKDMCSRNITRYPELAESIIMSRKLRHFIFYVESVGALKSADLVVEACRVMQEKCRNLLKLVEEL